MSGKVFQEKKKRSLIDPAVPAVAHCSSLDDPSINKLLKVPNQPVLTTSDVKAPEEDLSIDDDERPRNFAELESLSCRSIGHHEARLLYY